MASFFTDEEKSYLGGLFNDINHETFKRKVYAFKQDENVIMSEDPNYTSINKNFSSSVEKKTVKQEFFVRILHKKPQTTPSITGPDDGQLKLRTEDGEVRIRCDKAAYDYIIEAKRVELDGNIYNIQKTSGRPHGLFVVDFWDINLKKLT